MKTLADKPKILEALNFATYYARNLGVVITANGDGWSKNVKCPFHEDHNPSFGVNIQNGAFRCFSCNAKGDVFAFHMKRHGHDFPAALADLARIVGVEQFTQSKANARPEPKMRQRITATYDYHTADGWLLFQVCRVEPGDNGHKKSFRQRRPDGSGGWVWKTAGVERVLYRLPEVIKADEVLLAEGEKCADALRSLGFTATTNAGGAGKWSESYTEALTGKDVVIFSDNDKPGRDHAQMVAAALYGRARSINLIEFHDLPEKGDVFDFIESLPDRETAAERIAVMIEGAAPWTQNQEKPTKEKYADPEAECFLELLTEGDDDSGDTYEWHIEKLVPKKEPMIIGGKGGSGKSTLALEFAYQILDSDPKAAAVYICAEGTYRDTKIRARQMGLTKMGRFFFLKRKGGTTSFKLSERTDLKLVRDTLAAAKKQGLDIQFVVIDSIRGMQKGSLSEDAVGEVMQAVNSVVCQEIGATVAYIHHAKKNVQDMAVMDALLGSVTIVNSVRHALFIKKVTTKMREIDVCKSNLAFEDHYFRTSQNDLGRIEMKYMGHRIDADDEPDDSQMGAAEKIILSMLSGGDWVPAYQVFQRAEKEAVSVETIRRAKAAHDVDVKKIGNTWKWRLKNEHP